MGLSSSSPNTDKASGDGAAFDKGLVWGYSGMQGWRQSMEDAHFTIGDLEGWSQCALFGVLDGHGGSLVAHFTAVHLPQEVSRVAGLAQTQGVSAALQTAFHNVDELLGDEAYQEELRSYAELGGKNQKTDANLMGCTAVVCCISPTMIVVANAGDSRAILVRDGQVVPLSEDHKPQAPGERARITRAGGTVERQQLGPFVQFRVNGHLNLSRSIGDLQYKRNEQLAPHEQIICSTPDVQVFPRNPADEFIVMACDGIWDVLSNQDVASFVRERMRAQGLIGPGAARNSKTRPISRIAEELLDHCIPMDLSTTGGLGGDNMTALVIALGTAGHDLGPGSVLGAAAGWSGAHASQISNASFRTDDSDGFSSEETSVSPSGFCGCTTGLSKSSSTVK
mmetsp:Transcript_58261/g.138798  ORF Transcript_58261/g.138798 Transcript_58261/m.138798 type:complete len:395 (+) Transcript_58261:124-1308(+)